MDYDELAMENGGLILSVVDQPTARTKAYRSLSMIALLASLGIVAAVALGLF